MAQRILVFGDHPSSVEICRHLQTNFDLDRVEEVAALAARVSQSSVDLVIAALGCSVAASEAIRFLRETPAGAPVFVIVPGDADEELLSDVAEIAADFVVWPASSLQILQRIRRIVGDPPDDAEKVGERLVNEMGLKQFVGRDPAFLHVIAQIPIIARSGRPVVITGETGPAKNCALAQSITSDGGGIILL